MTPASQTFFHYSTREDQNADVVWLLVIPEQQQSVTVYVCDEICCDTCIEVELGHLQSVRLTLLLTETEDDDGLEVPLHDHLHYLEHIRWT